MHNTQQTLNTHLSLSSLQTLFMITINLFWPKALPNISRTFTENNSYVICILKEGYQDISGLISNSNHGTRTFQS